MDKHEEELEQAQIEYFVREGILINPFKNLLEIAYTEQEKDQED